MTSYANTPSKTDVYRTQNAMTASPGELTLMLYDGCIKEIKRMCLYIEEGGIEKANGAALQAQAILSELMRSLDAQYEISGDLYRLYEYMLGELVYANIHKQTQKAGHVLELMTELRDTWQQAIRINRQRETGRGSLI